MTIWRLERGWKIASSMFITNRRQGVLAVTQRLVEAIKQLTKAD
jgi:hypothetical protein